MRVLIVEDDFASRRLVQMLVSRFGSYDVAVNGNEAIELLKIAFDEGSRYDLVCLDINMPEMTGHEALEKMRQIEASHGVEGLDRTKIVMTTAYDDAENIVSAFREQCDAYLVKPIGTEKFDQMLKSLSLIPPSWGVDNVSDKSHAKEPIAVNPRFWSFIPK